MKKVLLVVSILCTVLAGYFLVSVAPYHIYTLTITEGVDTSFLKMSPSSKVQYDPSSLVFFQEDEFLNQSKSIIVPFYIGNYYIDLPINYYSISFIPSIKIESNQVKFGGDLIDIKNKSQFKFVIEKNFNFDVSFENQKLYSLPIFRNYLNKKSVDSIWADTFSRKLSLPSNDGESFINSLGVLSKISYKELVYNLYLLNLRKKHFPGEIKAFSYDEEHHLGVLKIKETADELIEKIYYLENGIIFPITISTNKNSRLGKHIRVRFIKKFKFKYSTKDDAIPIYAEYKNLNYTDRIDQKGMIYLYSAWSHDVENKDFIRVIIMFLERGTSNIKFLRPFYDYAFKKFGSTFSNSMNSLMETPDEKLKRQMVNELDKETKDELNKAHTKTDGEYQNIDDKVNDLLIKAKEKTINSDESKMELKIE